MSYVTTDYQLAAGHNNAGGLTAITSITDGSSDAFLEPLGLPGATLPPQRFGLDGSTARVGWTMQVWVFGFMTATQLRFMRDTYLNAVTVKTAIDQTTWANFNAYLVVPSPDELTYTQLASGPLTGVGYNDVSITLRKLEAI